MRRCGCVCVCHFLVFISSSCGAWGQHRTVYAGKQQLTDYQTTPQSSPCHMSRPLCAKVLKLCEKFHNRGNWETDGTHFFFFMFLFTSELLEEHSILIHEVSVSFRKHCVLDHVLKRKKKSLKLSLLVHLDKCCNIMLEIRTGLESGPF